MGRRPKWTFLQGQHIDGQEAHKKMLNIANYQRNANQNYREVPLHTTQKGHHQKTHKQDFPDGSVVKKSMQERQLQSLAWEDPTRLKSNYGQARARTTEPVPSARSRSR